MADQFSRKIKCSFCGNDLVVDPQSAVGKAVSLQSLLSIPGDLQQLEERRGILSRDTARLQKKIKACEQEGFYTGLRNANAILLFILIILYGSAFLGNIIHTSRVDIPKVMAIILFPAPLIALFVHGYPIIAWSIWALPIVGFIVGQSHSSQVPDEPQKDLEEKLTGLSHELISVNTAIRERQKTLEIYRDIMPRLAN